MEAERPLESMSPGHKPDAETSSPKCSRHQASPLAIATVLAPKASHGPLATLPFSRSGAEGTVLEVSVSGSTQELKINFPEVGLKKLLASVAPIEEIN